MISTEHRDFLYEEVMQHSVINRQKLWDKVSPFLVIFPEMRLIWSMNDMDYYEFLLRGAITAQMKRDWRIHWIDLP